MIKLSYEDLMEFAYSSIKETKDVSIDKALVFSILAVAFSNMAIAQELKKFNWESNYESNMERVRQEYEKNRAS